MLDLGSAIIDCVTKTIVFFPFSPYGKDLCQVFAYMFTWIGDIFNDIFICLPCILFGVPEKA